MPLGVFLTFAKYFWLIALVFSIPNGLLMWKRLGRHIQRDPSLRPGYERMLKHYLFWVNVPWVVMGVGVVFGDVATVFDYFRPRDGNPYVLAFHVTAYVMWVALLYWIFFRNGAATLIKYPGFLNREVRSEWIIKAFCIFAVAGGVIAAWLMWTNAIPQSITTP